MQIVLLRHGEPLIDKQGRITAAQFGHWLKQYDMAGLKPNNHIPSASFEIAAQSQCIVCSHLPRSIESAYGLGLKTIHHQDALFKECEMPYWNKAGISLSKMNWSILFRVLQIIGHSPHAESLADIRHRADQCVSELISLAQQHNKVLFVGHGAIIWFIHRRLKRLGWYCPKKAPRHYWQFGVYQPTP